jgi:selenocysteine lyase/cysteine desulfurase
MDRRAFLKTSGLAFGGGLAIARGREAAAAKPADAALDPTRWESIRAEFNLARDHVHLAGFFLASHPKAVREAIDAHRRGLDANPFGYFEDNVGKLEAGARSAAAEYLAGRSDDIALTDSTTMGLGTVYCGVKLRPGQEVLTTEHDHPSTQRALRFRAARSDASVRTIALFKRSDSASEDEIVSSIQGEIRPTTRLLAVTWVHSSTGLKIPIARIAEIVAVANRGRADEDRLLLSVDGVHGFGVEDFTIGQLGCDFFIAGCHKWIFGPRGTGLVWGAPWAWPVTSPTIPSFDGIWRKEERDALPISAQMTPGGFHSFEHRWALPEAFRFHLAIGKANVSARIHALNRQCKEGLASMKNVRLYTPMSDALSAGIICFDVDGRSSDEIVKRLRSKKIIASVAPYTLKCARFAPSLLTMPNDIDRALKELRALA